MELVYATDKVETQCTSVKAAIQPTFHFHKLENKNGRDLEGYFAIDVKSRREQWRILLQPLDDNKKPYHPCNIDQISGAVKVVEISEVSKHYE